MSDPNMSLCVYASDGQEINVDLCDVDKNPVVVEIGGVMYPFHRLMLYLGLAEAERLMIGLGQALQDRYVTADPPAPDGDTIAGPKDRDRVPGHGDEEGVPLDELAGMTDEPDNEGVIA
jgi:hypothetical protein